jgi:UDP-GlcNAc:undecaprenyl-phosphate GlcNAc-1-phosphate transferase
LLYQLLIVFVISVVLCALLTRLVRDLAVARGWVDAPDTSRHLHSRAVPRLGGVAIFVTVMGLAGGGVLARRWTGPAEAFSITTTFAILGPAALIFLMGIYDDLRTLGPYVKFGVQILAACLLYLNGIGIHQFDLLLRDGELHWIVGLPLTIIWVLLITNAFNLIDGLDGLAAGAALFSTIVLLVSSLFTGDEYVAFLAMVMAGAIVGFLRFNFNPATIFLGDSGSMFIGFMLSALGLAGSEKAPTMVAVAIPVVCFGLPILDVAIAVARRFLSGKPLFKGDREHIHHRLLKRGFSQRDAVLILYGVSAFFGLLSLALLHGGGTIALVLIMLGIGVCVGVPQLRYQEFSEMRRVLERTVSQKRIIENNLYVRRAAESLRTCDDVHELCRILVEALQPGGFDGFRLRPAGFRGPQILPALVREGPNGELTCFWNMFGAREADWELKLELVDRTGNKCGSFSVYKRLTGKPLMMDINLLSDGFQSALAGAVQRASLHGQGDAEKYGHKLAVDRAEAVSS